ncbi:class I lanthipeptide [Lacinutrix sp.]|uniref:class I lanthipeptide n=1 Tax=Lacinutrix sp. TaxID=1937692 RepID=UPI0025C5CD9E|nr:class I lanthipeptide [Lacinutrix sp.]
MKTQNTKLQFGKSSITELNDSQSLGVNGGCQWSESSGQTISIIKFSIQNPNDNNDFIAN